MQLNTLTLSKPISVLNSVNVSVTIEPDASAMMPDILSELA